MLIHIKRNAEVFGPYSVEEAREYLSAGRLSLSDFAQLPGTTEWIPLASVPGIKSAPPPPPPDSPNSEAQVPTDAGSNKASESTPPSRMSPWKRADKAFGFGCFVGIATTYSVQSDLSSSERMLLAGIMGVFCGLVAYLVAVVYYAGKGKLEVTAQTDAPKARNITRLVWVGIIGLYAILWLIEKNKETKTPQENPNSSVASPVVSSVAPSTIPSTPETQIQIPAPVGFVEGSRLSDILKKRAMVGDPVSVKLLGAYFPPDVLAEVLNQGDDAPSIPYCVAKLQKTYRSIADAKKGFQQLRVNIKKDTLDMNNPAVKNILEHYEKAATELSHENPVKVKGMVPVDTMIDSETVFASSMIVNFSGSEGDLPLAVAGAWVLVGTQQVQLMVAYPFTSKADIETAKRVLLQWVSDIQRLNGV